MRNTKGQYTHQITGKELIFTVTLLASMGYAMYVNQHPKFISPIPEYRGTATVYASERVSTTSGILVPSWSPTPSATPTPGSSEIIQYIAEVFRNEPTEAKVKVINCFYSESGLRWNAINDKNKNGTTDAGVAQVNDVHHMTLQDRLNFRKNVDKAYQIYKSWGHNTKAWYGSKCDGYELLHSKGVKP